jgi:cysteinyl-tRNA synthetase
MLSIDEINKLEKEYDIVTKQYNSLLKQYNEVLRLAKENADSNEYCLQELERRLAPFQDDYFKGLTEEQIAELAKKSIRITKDNCELTHVLEDIRDLVRGHKVADEVRLKSILHCIDKVLK